MNTIFVTINRFEDKWAILKTDDGQEIRWPKAHLPREAKIGMALQFNLMTEKEANLSQKELAKKILKEIIGEE